MKYKYARRNNFLEFEELDDRWVRIENYMTEDSQIVPHVCYDTLLELDGEKNPCDIMNYFTEEEVEKTLTYFKEDGWLYNEKRITPLGFGSFIFRLVTPTIKEWHRVIARVWNFLLMFLSIPIFAAGLYVSIESQYHTIDHWYGIYIGCALAFLSSMFFPEFCQTSACIAYGGDFLEGGILVKKFIASVYMALDYDNVENNRFSNHQIKFVESEYHIALAGIFFLLLKTDRMDFWAMLIPAVLNVILAFYGIF